jgi:CubicO group peptidase (beta-lactamase class C family)
MAAILPLGTRGESLIEVREAYARIALGAALVHPPRGAFLYSNAGFVVAGHVAEVATGKPWEELVTELLFRPLGMTSAGFGPPGAPDVYDAPRGHATGRAIEPGSQADNPPVLGPAGTVHATLADWAKFVALHLEGCHGDVRVGAITLTRDAFAVLHRPYDGPGQGYALGWVVDRRPWAGGDGTTLWHNGSNTLWYCVTWLGPENRVAMLATTNEASPRAARAVDAAIGLMLERAKPSAEGAR